MAKIYDTLATKLSDLRDGIAKDEKHAADLDRYLRMGAHWVNEREAQMAEMFAHLFPAAYAEPVVDAGPYAGVTVEDMAAARDAEKAAHKRSTEWFTGEIARLKEHISSFNPLNVKDMLGKAFSAPVDPTQERRVRSERREIQTDDFGDENRSGEIRRRADYEERRHGTERRTNPLGGFDVDRRAYRMVGDVAHSMDRRVNPQLFVGAVTLDPTDAETFGQLPPGTHVTNTAVTA